MVGVACLGTDRYRPCRAGRYLNLGAPISRSSPLLLSLVQDRSPIIFIHQESASVLVHFHCPQVTILTLLTSRCGLWAHFVVCSRPATLKCHLRPHCLVTPAGLSCPSPVSHFSGAKCRKLLPNTPNYPFLPLRGTHFSGIFWGTQVCATLQKSPGQLLVHLLPVNSLF